MKVLKINFSLVTATCKLKVLKNFERSRKKSWKVIENEESQKRTNTDFMYM